MPAVREDPFEVCPTPWSDIQSWLMVEIGAMVLGLFLAYLSRAHGLVLLKRPAGYLWLGGMLSALPTFALRIPRIGKFVCLFIVVILGVPALLVAGSIYVLDDGKPSTTSKPKDKSEGTPRDEVEADETSKESKKTK